MNKSSENQNGSYLGSYTSRFASRLLKSSEIEDEEIKLITKLGSGTFGTVWKGECFGSTVAIKVPIPEKASALTREEIEYLRNEINIMTTNLHPNLILCLGACTEPSKFKIVLEIMDGDLERLLIKSAVGKKMTVWQRMALAKDAARGMLWLHSMNPAIIHRDLKLENLMYKKIDKSYHVKISDFGLSILKPQRISRLRGERVGTLTTMAPEILKGSNYNEKADVYSFSMLLWQIYTCERLYSDLDDLSNEALESGICKNEIRPKIPSDCSPSLKKLMEDCWHDNPEKRPDFEEINARLDAILVELAITDPQGQAFWSEHFLKEHLVPWEEFSKQFYGYLGSVLPEKGRRRYSEIFARTNYLCLKTILTNAGEDEDAGVHIERFGEILNLFGPLNKRRASSFRSNILDNIRKVVCEKWFHGTVERAEAHRRLEGREAGTFLVRVTPREHEAFVLTILKKKGGAPHNLAIHKKEDGRFTVGHDESKTYLSLNAVLREIEKLSQLQLIPCPGWPFSSCFDDDEGWEEKDSSAELSSTYSRVADLMSSMRSVETKEKIAGETKDSVAGAKEKDKEDDQTTNRDRERGGKEAGAGGGGLETKGPRDRERGRAEAKKEDDDRMDRLAGAGRNQRGGAADEQETKVTNSAVKGRDKEEATTADAVTVAVTAPRNRRGGEQLLAGLRDEDEAQGRSPRAAMRGADRDREREEEKDLDERLELLRAKLREREKERENSEVNDENGRYVVHILDEEPAARSPVAARMRDRAKEREREDDREAKKGEDDRGRPAQLQRRATIDELTKSPLSTLMTERLRERERVKEEQRREEEQRLRKEREDRATARERERARAADEERNSIGGSEESTPVVLRRERAITPNEETQEKMQEDRPVRAVVRDEERDKELRELDEKIEQLRTKIKEREREREREIEDGPRREVKAKEEDGDLGLSVSGAGGLGTSTTTIALAAGKKDSNGSGGGSGGSGGTREDDVSASPDPHDRRKQREEERRKQREKWQKEEEERKKRREQIKRQLSERPGRE